MFVFDWINKIHFRLIIGMQSDQKWLFLDVKVNYLNKVD